VSTGLTPEQEARRSHTVGTISSSAFWVFASAVAMLAVGFVGSLIIARVLGPSDQGVFAAITVDATVLVDVLGLGVPAAALYYASRSRPERKDLLGVSLVHAALVGAVALALALLLGPRLAEAQGAGDRASLYVLAALVVPVAYLEVACMNLLRSRLRFRLANILVILGRVASLVAVLGLVVALDLGVAGALASVIALSLVQVLGSLFVIAREGVGFSWPVARRSLHYGARAQVGQVSRFASARFDILLLSFFAPSRIVGFYAISQLVAELVLMVPRAFGTILTPVMAPLDEPGELSGRMLRLNGTLSLLATLIVAGLGPPLILYGYGSAYRDAIVPLLILLPGIWMLSVGNLVLFLLAARGRPGTASWLAVAQAVLTVGLDILLIPPFDATGAAVASAVSYIVFGLACLVTISRRDRTRTLGLVFVSVPELRSYVPALRDRLRGLRDRPPEAT
jgi:O-antigen/teichoic acid export membrane protein